MRQDDVPVFDQIRMKLWTDIAVAVASSSNCVHIQSPVRWADSVLEQFDNRFKQKGEDGTSNRR